MPQPDARSFFDSAIRDLIGDALKLVARDPLAAASILRTLGHQRAAERRRASNTARGIPVPAMVIVSVTQNCNLHCAGCYAHALHNDPGPELSTAELGDILRQASDLGVSIALLAGGEPLLRGDLLELTQSRPEMLFALFTNGTLLDAPTVERLAHQRHVIPVLSLEGHQAETDARRGSGMHAHTLDTMARLRDRGLLFGTSLTATSQNYDVLCDRSYIQELVSQGCRLFVFVEYVPTVPGTEFLVLTGEQRATLPSLLEEMHASLPGLFVALPGDESLYGGCLAAGRGFVHINPQGRLEPCPFAPWSDTSLRDMPLAEALRSPFMAALRESDVHLTETAGGCALWSRRDWVTSLLGPAAVSEPEPSCPGSTPAS
ncbi:MAG: radical SAM protein [Anaerolineae bacterium]